MEIAAKDLGVGHAAVYRRLASVDCRDGIAAGIALTIYHLYAVPHIAELLYGTGKLAADLPGRLSSVGRLLTGLLDNGFDSEESRFRLRAMNKAHRSFATSSDDHRYALAAFAVVPVQFVERHGRHRITPDEREASALFYRDLGRHMGLRDCPADFAGARRLMETFQRAHVGRTFEGQALALATDTVVGPLMPAGKRPGDLLTPRVRSAVAPTIRDLLIS